MNQNKWLIIALSLFSVSFSFTSHAYPAICPHAFPNENYQFMSLPTDNIVHMGDPMDTPAMGFALVGDGQGAVSYGLPESMIRKSGYFFEDGEPYIPFRGTYRVGLEFAAGRFVAIDQNYGGVTLFAVPEAPMEFTNLLLNLKAYKLEARNWAGSLGFGIRHMDRGFRKVYGVNFFYDYLDQRGSFNQLGLGFELLSSCWECHINGYWPIGNLHHSLSEKILKFKSEFIGIFRENLNALRGVELTVGGRWSFFDNLNLYVAPGLYIYNSKDIRKSVQGFQGICEVNWNEWVSAKVNVSYDRQFKGRVQGVIALNIPLNFKCCCEDTCCCCTCDILGYPVRRNDLIFLKKCCSVERNWDDCGHRIP